MNSFQSRLLQNSIAKRKRKQNGFTLIELMVVVAIVGVLTAVGLPELTKAQNRAKDSAAKATLTNAAKECSLSLITLGNDDDYTGGTANTPFASVSGTCSEGTTLELDSDSGETASITFNGAIPGVVSISETNSGG